jgi:predicted NAD/FAD-binding protein
MRIAVVGAGIAGLSSAWLLSQRHRVTLYEAAPRLGGHTNTIDVTVDGATHPVDTGFLVFNHRTYPNLTALFAHLGVATAASEMTFAVSLLDRDLEWAGENLATVFAQKRNLARPAFWRMLADILRFNRQATRAAAAGDADAGATLGEFVRDGRYGEAFRDWYLLPMAAAIWSCPTRTMLDYPFATFARFCLNHGLLQVEGRPQWMTVSGGGREYVRRIAAALPDVRLGSPVRAVDGLPGHFKVATDAGTEEFDNVVLACHSDQALRLLSHPTVQERDILASLPFQPNRAVLHTDRRLLPRRRSVWSAWNYIGGAEGVDGRAVGVSYLLNKLQPLPFSTPVVVTLNPPIAIRDQHVIAEIEYEHPIFDRAGIAAQNRLDSIQGRRGLWFCGAWTGFGFHEDGLKAGLAVGNALGCVAPWQRARDALPTSHAPTAVVAPATDTRLPL